MAIGIHVVKVIRDLDDAEGDQLRVQEDADVANSADTPTLEAYLALEAADDYLPSLYAPPLLVTASVADMNAL